ncbi:unannotated protein [freshwater metagenome]|uniref:Unannotated protein n=1 Tax=freshwater metagenome TaxID=449393 RepID=A0A6J7PY41_9ZZZZ
MFTSLSVVKSPPTRTFPSNCTATLVTVPLNPVPIAVVNAVSGLPSEFRRTMYGAATLLKVVKMPAATTRPSDCAATEITRVPLPGPVPIAVEYAVSRSPSSNTGTAFTAPGTATSAAPAIATEMTTEVRRCFDM